MSEASDDRPPRTVEGLTQDGQMCHLRYFRAGVFWYEVEKTGFYFGVPVEDVNHTTVYLHEEAYVLENYISKQIETNKEANEL